MKVSLSRLHRMQLVLDFIVAALHALYNKASSPKESPAKYVLTNFGFSPSLNFLKQSNSPSSTTNRQSPISPCLITKSLGLNNLIITEKFSPPLHQ